MTTDERDLLAANEAFYRCFAARDLSAMSALWARSIQVACVHPGWRALLGREDVLASWASILGGAGAPRIAFRDPEVCLRGDMGFVLCVESLPGGELAATNVFAREDGEWRIVHHHAGPIDRTEPDPDDDGPPPGWLN